MRLSAAALMLVLGLATAAPRHEFKEGNLVVTVNIATDDVAVASHNSIDKAAVQVNIPSGPQSTMTDFTAVVHTLTVPRSTHGLTPQKQEKIPGWMFFDGKSIQARIHGNTFWNIKGELDEDFKHEEFLFDPLVFSLNHPTDFEGDFTGQIGRGEITLKWEKSGASIVGRSSIGDFEIKGKTRIDWSP